MTATSPPRWSERQRAERRPPSRHAPGPSDRTEGRFVVRFDRSERILHWVTAAAMSVAMATGGILYVKPLAVAVGRRALVKDIHVVAGFATVVPVLALIAIGAGAGLRRDLRRFANWHPDDVQWFRRRWRTRSETGKFNGGQKLSAVLFGSSMATLLMTGIIMRWFGPFPLAWRTGATFVHDWVSFGLWFLVPAHVIKATVTAGALRGMWTGWAPAEDLERRPRWRAEVDTGESVVTDEGR